MTSGFFADKMSDMKPMLATTITPDKITFPVLGSSKLDGIRCIMMPECAMSRRLKPIRNQYIQDQLKNLQDLGLDGELIVGSPTSHTVYSTTSSGVMSAGGEPDFHYYVFDIWDQPDTPYVERYAQLKRLYETYTNPIWSILPQYVLRTPEDLLKLESNQLRRGFEGVILRSPRSPYKYGRSTAREQYLLKRKPTEDAEGVVLSWIPLEHNTNEQERNAIGQAKRSNHKQGMVEDWSQLGSLLVMVLTGPFKGQTVSIGTGFSQQERQTLAQQGDKLKGLVVKFTYQAEGAKDRPRFPSYKGFRDRDDM